MMSALTFLCVIAATVCLASADTCYDNDGYTWYCSYSCCYSFSGCCVTLSGGYWYAWFLISLFFFVCLCSCAGCGSYGYRRYYVVRRVSHPPPTVITTTSANNGYQQFGNHGNQQYKGYDAPPPYNPKTVY